MRTIGKLIALFYGSQMLLGGIRMALFCYLRQNAFAEVSKDFGIDLLLFNLTADLFPQIGLGSLLVWLGLPSRSRIRAWRLTRTTVNTVIEN